MPAKPPQINRPIVNPNELIDAYKNENVPKMYFNGVTLGLTNADVVILVKRNNVPITLFNISLTVAKTFAKQLNALIIDFENNADNEIMTSDVIETAIIKMKDARK